MLVHVVTLGRTIEEVQDPNDWHKRHVQLAYKLFLDPTDILIKLDCFDLVGDRHGFLVI
jgi:hypothetical protein